VESARRCIRGKGGSRRGKKCPRTFIIRLKKTAEFETGEGKRNKRGSEWISTSLVGLSSPGKTREKGLRWGDVDHPSGFELKGSEEMLSLILGKGQTDRSKILEGRRHNQGKLPTKVDHPGRA